MTVPRDAEDAGQLGLRVFEQMLRTRGLEDEVRRMFAQGLVRGTTNLCQAKRPFRSVHTARLQPGTR